MYPPRPSVPSHLLQAGEAYFIPPGHLPVMEKDAVMVEFSQDPTCTDAKGIRTLGPRPLALGTSPTLYPPSFLQTPTWSRANLSRR